MPLLVLGAIRAIWVLRREPEFVSLGLLAAIAIVTGTAFYSLVEGLRFVDALYFSVVTLTTVGYGDFAPETDVGKLFMAVYVLVGVGILLAFVTTLAGKMSQTSPLHPFTSQPERGGDFASRDDGLLPEASKRPLSHPGQPDSPARSGRVKPRRDRPPATLPPPSSAASSRTTKALRTPNETSLVNESSKTDTLARTLIP